MVSVAPALIYRLAAIGLIAVGLTLSGCGRKGPLDAPPGGLAASEDGAPQEPGAAGGAVLRKGGVRGLPTIQGPDRPIPLDALLN